MAEAGRPTILIEPLFKKIKKSILEGNDLRKTAKVCEINEGTFYEWHEDNYLNLATRIEGWKRDRMLMLATGVLKDILEIGAGDKESLKVVQDTAKFVASTLGRDDYSTRNELTGKDGTPIIVIPAELIEKNKLNNANGTTSSTEG